MCLRQGSLLQSGKYRIEKLLGQGGFGITYLAEQTLLASRVAIKEFFFRDYCERDSETSCVRIGVQSNKGIVEKFMRKFMKEAQLIARFQHPNIIQIKDVFRENGTVYYVMDYIEGESLSDMINRRGTLMESEAFEYIRQTALALDYIHKQHVNHLDIKPGNIMVRSKSNRAILIDFGVSKQYDEVTQEGTTTAPVCITGGYSPPEQYYKDGVSSFSPQSDVYALGATLYKLLTGITPPNAMEVPQIGLLSMVKGLSETAQALVVHSMQYRKQDRLQDAAAFLKLMDCAQKGSNHLKRSSIPSAEVIDDMEFNGELSADSGRNYFKRWKGVSLTSKVIWLCVVILFCVTGLCVVFWPTPAHTPSLDDVKFSFFSSRGDSIISIEKQKAMVYEPVDYTTSKQRLDAAMLQYEKAMQQKSTNHERRDSIEMRLNVLKGMLPIYKLYKGVCDTLNIAVADEMPEQIGLFSMKRDSISNIIKSNFIDL